MQPWTFPAVFDQYSADEVTVTFQDVPEAITGAPTLGEARIMAADALEEAILGRLTYGEPIPSPRAAGPGEEDVVLDAVTAARAALAQAMSADRLTNVALATRLGKSEGAVRRLISGERGVKMETVLLALAATGRQGAFVTL